MEFDLSLIEIAGEDDDSLLRLEDPSDGIFPCSPVRAPTPTLPDTAAHPSLVGGLRSVQFSESFGGRGSKENIDVNADGTKLNMDPLQMKRRKKAKGYNMRKSLAWNKAFFTEEGVLDPEELSLVTGTFNLSSGEPLPVIQEEKNKLSKSCSPHVQSPKEQLYIKSPGLGRGLSPRCESSTRYRISPAKESSSPHVSNVRRLLLSAQEVNRKGAMHNGCPRPQPSSSYKRPASTSASSTTSKEPKLTKLVVPRADRCSLPTAHRSMLPKASCSSRIPGAEAKRVPSSPKLVAVVGKGSLVNTKVVKDSMVITKGVKGSVTNTSGVKSIAKPASCPKPSSLKQPAKQPGLNMSKLPTKAPTTRDTQVSHVFGAPNLVHQHDMVSKKHNNIPLPQKCFPDDSQRQVSHVQAGKPTGLRMPSPSLGFFGRPKQSGSQGNSCLSNIPEISSYYPGVINLDVAQRPLQAQEIVPRVSNGLLEANVREPLSTMVSTSSHDVQADVLEECLQTLSHDFDRNSQTPSESKKCNERADMQALCTYDNPWDINKSYNEPLKCDENRGKDDNSCKEELKGSLFLEGCSVSELEMQGCSSDNQQIVCSNQRSVFGSEQPSEEGKGGRKCNSSEGYLKGCKESIDERMNRDASFPNPRRGVNQGLVSVAREEDLKDGLSLEDYFVSAADNSPPIIQDKQKSWDDSDQPSVEKVETSQHDSCEVHWETYNESLDGYDPSLQDESVVLGLKVQKCLTDSRKDRNLYELECNYLSGFKPFTSVAEGNVVEDINNVVHVASHVDAPDPHTVSSLGMLTNNSSKSSYPTTDDRFGASELKASDSEPNSLGKFQLTTSSSNVLQKPDVPEEDNAASSSYLKVDESGFVEAEVFAVNKLPSTKANSEIVVEGMHKFFSECDIPLQMSNNCDLVEILTTDIDETADESVRLQQRSNQVTEFREAVSDIYQEQYGTTESKNYLGLALLNLKNAVDHNTDCSLGANHEPTILDGDVLGNSSSQLEVVEKTNVVCEADAFTDSLSSQNVSPSKACHMDCSEDHFDMPEAGLDVVLQKQSSGLSNNLDVGKLERNVAKTVSADNDTISNVAAEQIHDDTSSNLGENGAQHYSNPDKSAYCSKNTASNSKSNCIVIKPPPDFVPFSDEWLASVEAAGEDILTLKSGAVQHSPTEKSLPEPSPWSPVKRNKNQGIGPFDCTKHTSAPAPPADD